MDLSLSICALALYLASAYNRLQPRGSIGWKPSKTLILYEMRLVNRIAILLQIHTGWDRKAQEAGGLIEKQRVGGLWEKSMGHGAI